MSMLFYPSSPPLPLFSNTLFFFVLPLQNSNVATDTFSLPSQHPRNLVSKSDKVLLLYSLTPPSSGPSLVVSSHIYPRHPLNCYCLFLVSIVQSKCSDPTNWSFLLCSNLAKNCIRKAEPFPIEWRGRARLLPPQENPWGGGCLGSVPRGLEEDWTSATTAPDGSASLLWPWGVGKWSQQTISIVV